MKIIERRNRKTGEIVALHRHQTSAAQGQAFVSTYYELECAKHGCLSDWLDTRREADKLIAHPDEWCIECMEDWE